MNTPLPFRLRIARPTIADAQERFCNGGGGTIWSRDWDVSPDERRESVFSLIEDLEQKIADHFPATANLEYAILKCHLLVQSVMESFIGCMSYYRVDHDKLRLSFAQKLEVAAMLGFGTFCNRTIPSVEMLNRVRNQVAHRFSIDRGLIDETYKWWAEDPDIVNTASDTDRIEFLRFLCNCITGHTSGVLLGWARNGSLMSGHTDAG